MAFTKVVLGGEIRNSGKKLGNSFLSGTSGSGRRRVLICLTEQSLLWLVTWKLCLCLSSAEAVTWFCGCTNLLELATRTCPGHTTVIMQDHYLHEM